MQNTVEVPIIFLLVKVASALALGHLFPEACIIQPEKCALNRQLAQNVPSRGSNFFEGMKKYPFIFVVETEKQ